MVRLEDITDEDVERTAGQTWFAAGLFAGFGASPVIGVVLYAIGALFFGHWLAMWVVLVAALLSFGVGLAYIALARTLEE